MDASGVAADAEGVSRLSGVERSVSLLEHPEERSAAAVGERSVNGAVACSPALGGRRHGVIITPAVEVNKSTLMSKDKTHS
jgi:hypothetical protein